MSNNAEKNDTSAHVDEDIKMGLTKKQRSWVYTGIFFTVVIILFIINNTNGVPEQGPYPPHYQDSQLQFLNSSDLKGKVVLLNFWATWNLPCREEIPDLVELKDKYKGKEFEIVGISVDAITRGGSTANDVEPFMEALNINYPIVRGNENTVYAFGNISSIPTTFLLDKTGMIVAKYENKVTKATYEAGINSVLNNTFDSEKVTPAPEFSLPIIENPRN